MKPGVSERKTRKKVARFFEEDQGGEEGILEAGVSFIALARLTRSAEDEYLHDVCY